MNSTGNSLLGMFATKEFAPKAMEARPIALNSVLVYFSPRPFLNRVPMSVPATMQAVLTMVPSILLANIARNPHQPYITAYQTATNSSRVRGPSMVKRMSER